MEDLTCSSIALFLKGAQFCKKRVPLCDSLVPWNGNIEDVIPLRGYVSDFSFHDSAAVNLLVLDSAFSRNVRRWHAGPLQDAAGWAREWSVCNLSLQ